jgi:hypothetical protein
VECAYRYQDFTVEDFIVVDRMTLHGNITENDTSILNIHFENRDIADDGLIMDTVFATEKNLADVQISISKIEYHVSEKCLRRLKDGMEKIDDFFLFDTLVGKWRKQMDLLDLSNIDMLPVYQFQLKDMEKEMKHYDSNEYEILLSKSGRDNRDYLQKRASVFVRLENIFLVLSQKISVMDELMYEKAKQYEKENNLQKAIFYYTRTLDYNPLHCDALERLSDLYVRNNLHQENIDLFKGLKIRGEDVSCESSLSAAVCDSMCMKAAHLIEQRNYYDAVKFLDTMEQLFYQIPDTTYFQTYLNLRKQAQTGIYNSYFDVINRAIKGNKTELSKEYIYGLVDIMEKDENFPSENKKFTEMMNYFISRYKENTKVRIRKKNYEEVILNHHAMIVFLDSIRYGYDKNIFFDSYTTSCTAIYCEKKNQSEEAAEAFRRMYPNYILLTKEEIPDNEEIIPADNQDQKRYDFLVNYVLNRDISPDDFFMLDTVATLLQLETEQENPFSALDSIFVETKLIPLLSNALSKVNHYSWTNELLHANGLMKKIDKVVMGLNLTKDTSAFAMKYFQTVSLLSERINQRAGQEFNTLLEKVKQLTLQRKYWQAYQLLKDDNLLLLRTHYQQHIERLAKEIEPPAIFEEKMLGVEQDLALEDYTSGFESYENAYIYFINQDIAQYGLVCDSLPAFVKKHEQEKFLRGACFYYIDRDNCLTALDMMMYLIDLGYKSTDIQIKLGLKMKQSSYDFDSLLQTYVFTEVHHPFLEHYRRKMKAFFYRLKQWKLFHKKK